MPSTFDKREFTKVLDAVLKAAGKLGYHDAFVAGGAARDLRHGLKPKDIDVFTFQAIPTESQMFDSDSDPLDGRVAGVSQTLLQGFPYTVELISLHPCPSPRAAVEQFAIGLDQAWYDDELHTTKAFDRDWTAKTFTVTRAQGDHEARRTVCKLNRLWARGYYLDHRLVIPREFMPQFFDKAWYGETVSPIS